MGCTLNINQLARALQMARLQSPGQASRFMSRENMVLTFPNPLSFSDSVAAAFRFFEVAGGALSFSRGIIGLVGDTRTPRTLFMIGSLFTGPAEAIRAGGGDGDWVRILRFWDDLDGSAVRGDAFAIVFSGGGGGEDRGEERGGSDGRGKVREGSDGEGTGALHSRGDLVLVAVWDGVFTVILGGGGDGERLRVLHF
jgi:hypothetical protein